MQSDDARGVAGGWGLGGRKRRWAVLTDEVLAFFSSEADGSILVGRSRREGCHLADAPCPPVFERLLHGEGRVQQSDSPPAGGQVDQHTFHASVRAKAVLDIGSVTGVRLVMPPAGGGGGGGGQAAASGGGQNADFEVEQDGGGRWGAGGWAPPLLRHLAASPLDLLQPFL